jgi:anti-sigma factor ChrR (cupin superfamily)
MKTPHAAGEPAELAALYAAGAMPHEQLRDYESHLAAGCPQCAAELRQFEEAVEHLYSAVEPVPVDVRLRDRVMSHIEAGEAFHSASERPDPQVWRRWQPDDAAAAMLIRRGAEAQWEPTGIDGIHIRRLFVDQQRNQMTALVKMAAGTAYPRHLHDGPEECYVLQGDLHVGEDILHAGDYQRAAPGSHHPIQSTKDGCLLLIVSSLTDEIE